MGHDQLQRADRRLKLVGGAGDSPAPSYGTHGATDLDEIRRRLLHVGRRNGLKRADAEAIADWVLASVFRKSKVDSTLFQRPADVWRFAVSAALNQVRNKLRDDLRRSALEADDEPEPNEVDGVVEERPSPLDRVLRAEAYALMNQALSKLPKACVEIFAQVHRRGQKPADVARERGISIETVYAQASKAMSVARRTYHEYLRDGTGEDT